MQLFEIFIIITGTSNLSIFCNKTQLRYCICQVMFKSATHSVERLIENTRRRGGRKKLLGGKKRGRKPIAMTAHPLLCTVDGDGAAQRRVSHNQAVVPGLFAIVFLLLRAVLQLGCSVTLRVDHHFIVHFCDARQALDYVKLCCLTIHTIINRVANK